MGTITGEAKLCIPIFSDTLAASPLGPSYSAHNSDNNKPKNLDKNHSALSFPPQQVDQSAVRSVVLSTPPFADSTFVGPSSSSLPSASPPVSPPSTLSSSNHTDPIVFTQPIHVESATLFPQASSSSSVVSDQPSELPGIHNVSSFLLSETENVFTASGGRIVNFLTMHHLPRTENMTVRTARHALLSHILTGGCVAACGHPSDAVKHSCKCRRMQTTFPTANAMSFHALSVLLSASEDRFPDEHVATVATCLGLEDTSRYALNSHLSTRRHNLILRYSSSNTARHLFDSLEGLPKGTLISLSHAHGLAL
jgi:hypothetical protein